MTRTAWNRFVKARDRYRNECEQLHNGLPELQAMQQTLIDSRSPSYRVETPIVYNKALDDVSPESEIRLILVGDNPGRREQAAENRRYLVGPSGKIAEGFFRNNPALNIDFRKNVIILNKTPIHTPRTVELRELCKRGSESFAAAFAESQQLMARLLLEFHETLNCGDALPVWITGYSEMGKGGVFETYSSEIKAIYQGRGLTGGFADRIFLYRHFSMNQFTIDLKRQAVPGEPLTQTLERIGAAYRKRFLY